jgi:periplasmic divalent cation tolerance protein
MTSEYIIVLVTAPNEEDAGRIGRALVEERLAACANIIRSIRSIYRWEGRIEDEQEALMIVKTKKELFQRVKERVIALHTYSVPEIIALPIVSGSEPYLNWIQQETDSDKL